MKTLVTSLLLIIFSTLLIAQSTGSISGLVTDAATGEAIYGANVTIKETNYHTASKSDGSYLINNVKPGKYTLSVSYIGYRNSIVPDVAVRPGKDTVINIIMHESSIQTNEVMVQGRLSAVKMSISNSTSAIRYDDYYTDHNTEEYAKIDETGFLKTIKHPLSTFAADVDAASYANVRRFILQNQLPYKDAVRTEELINYFNYSYQQPDKDKPLKVNMEYSSCPWNKGNSIIRIGIKGRMLPKEEQKPCNLVFLIDVSGSMNEPQKLPLLKSSFKMLVEQLKPEDKIAIVVYAGRAGLVLPATDGSDKRTIIDAIERLDAGGSTAGGEGIQLAYKVAKQNFISGGNNRVILATDGDFNVGISSTSELVRFIEEKRDDGIFLTVLGFGMGNYKDNRLQELADKGNGTHAYIDNIMEAKKVLVNEVTSTLFTIAKDVKIQVEFNPAKIKSYRLLGYENRMLNEKDFKDDKKDAGEIGAGHTVTALYEVEPETDPDIMDDLKYQKSTIKKEAFNSDEVLTVRIRYKEPDQDSSKEFSEILTGKPIDYDKASEDHRFTLAVAGFAMLLRDSEFKGTSTMDSVLSLARAAKGEDSFGYRSEFIMLAERAELLLKNQQANIK